MLEYGQKVLIKGKYTSNPEATGNDDGYEEYAGEVAYVRDPAVHVDGDNKWVTLKKTANYKASLIDVHPEDLSILSYVESEENPRKINKRTNSV